jgi:hypothetical protein
MESATAIQRKLMLSLKTFFYNLRCLSCIYVELDEPKVTIPSRTSQSTEDNVVDLNVLELTSMEIARDEVTFHDLPHDCKLEIFSYLSYEERGNAERVCSDWMEVMRTPSLWKNIDLTRFKRPIEGQFTTTACYESYKMDVQKFVDYLSDIDVNLKSLRFAFDIGEGQDGWLKMMRGFIANVRTQDLRTAQLNWKETPLKPFKSENATWSTNNFNDLMYSHRRRQRHFVQFFDYFSANATHLTSLSLPFDWSSTSIKALGRLTRLETLSLDSYFIPLPLEQNLLDQLLEVLPTLQQLTVSVCVGSGPGLVTFDLASESLRSLDLSPCQGFCLGQVNLPRLTELKTSLKPYGISTSEFFTSTSVPCLYRVLRAGAPKLTKLNGHVLRGNWRDNCYDELDSIFVNVCACAVHKPIKEVRVCEMKTG